MHSNCSLPKTHHNRTLEGKGLASKRFQQRLDRTSPRGQLQLFEREPSPRRQAQQTSPIEQPAINAKPAPSSWYQSKAERFWMICNHNGKPFGGLYYRVEVDFILKHFSGRTGLIEPREFDVVAERIVAHTHRAEQGVAA